MKRRNPKDIVETEWFTFIQDQSTGVPEHWVGGDRRKGNVTLLQASVRNSGKCLSDAKRASQKLYLEGLSINADRLGGPLHSSDEVSVMEMEPRERPIQHELTYQPAKGRVR